MADSVGTTQSKKMLKRKRTSSTGPNKKPKFSRVPRPLKLWQRSNSHGGRVEKKTIDLGSSIFACSVAGTFSLLNGTVPGTQSYQRVGRKINMTSIQLRGYIGATAFAAPVTSDTEVRIMLVYDKQANTAGFAITDLLKSQLNAGTTSSLCNDMLNLDNRDRFTILKDMTVALAYQNSGAANSTQGSVTVVDVNCYLKCNLETIYNSGTAGTIGDIQTGSLYLVTIGDVANYSYYCSTRVRYTDE